MKSKIKLTPKLDLAEVNYEKYPWPYKDSSVEEVTCTHILSKIPGKQRGALMEEIYRILIPSGKANFIIPYWSSMRSIMDYAYEWPPICEMSFLCFNKKWRDENKNHPELKCDFDFNYGYAGDPETNTKSQEVQAFYYKHYLGAAFDLHISLTKRA